MYVAFEDEPCLDNEWSTAMPKAVSVNEAEANLGDLLGYLRDQDDDVIVLQNGEPKAVLIAYGTYGEIAALRKQQRRVEALQELRVLRREVQAGNPDLTEDYALGLADRLAHEVVDDMAVEGKVTFERDR
jgi:prevent-host-death family protein